MEDAPQLGQAHRVVTNENNAAVGELVKENRLIVEILDISVDSAQNIVHDML